MIDAKRKAFIFLAISFVLIVITGGLILNEVRSIQAETVMVKVAVAKEDLPTYNEITPEMIKWVELPESENMGNFVTQEADLRDVIAIVHVAKGDFVTKNILRSKVDLPQNHRVVWLNVTDNVVLDQPLAEGDTVDIIVTNQGEHGEVTTTTRFNNVQVVQRVERTERDDEIKVSLSHRDAEQFIHYQHTAQHIRVLLVNQIQQTKSLPTRTEQDTEQKDEQKQEESGIAEEETHSEEPTDQGNN